MTSGKTIEPDLAHFGTIPRIVRRRRRAWAKIIALRIFMLPLILVGVFSLLSIAVLVTWTVGGTEHAANVDRVWTGNGSPTASPVHIDYDYPWNGTLRRGSQTIDAGGYRMLNVTPPLSVRVRSIGVGAWIYDAPLEPNASAFEVAAPALFGSLLGLLLGMGCYFFAFTVPARARWLYANGTAAPGHIVKKIQRVQGKTIALTLTYDFFPLVGPERSGALSVWRGLFTTACEGEAIVILYDPGNPERNLVYEYGDYELA